MRNCKSTNTNIFFKYKEIINNKKDQLIFLVDLFYFLAYYIIIMEIEEIIRTLPIGYYLGYSFDVFI